jgi:hypothetical protein
LHASLTRPFPVQFIAENAYSLTILPVKVCNVLLLAHEPAP